PASNRRRRVRRNAVAGPSAIDHPRDRDRICAARPAAPASRPPASTRPPSRCSPPPTACGPGASTARRSSSGHGQQRVPARSCDLLRRHLAGPPASAGQVAAWHGTRNTVADRYRPLPLEVRPVPPVVAAERARLELRAVWPVTVGIP